MLLITSSLFSQEKNSMPNDQKPAYVIRYFADIIKKEGKDFGLRYSPIPEQLWVVKLPKPICTKPAIYNEFLVAPAFSQKAHVIRYETGKVASRTNHLGGACIGIFIGNFINIQTFCTTGRYYSYRINMEGRPVDVSVKNGIVGVLYDGEYGYTTKESKYPGRISTRFGKDNLDPETDLPAKVSAVLCKAGPEFWLGLENGQLLSFNNELTKNPTFITLDKTYANSLAGDYQNIYVTTADKKLIAFQRSTGKEIWRKELKGLCYDRLVVEGERLYVCAKNFYVVNRMTGEFLMEKENIEAEGFGRTAPVITDNRIYVCDRKGYLFIFDKETFQQYQAINLDEDVLIDFLYHENSIYIGTVQSKLYRLDVSLY